MPTQRRFGDRLAHYRIAKNLTQEALANEVNKLDSELPDGLSCQISKDRIGNIERMRYEPSLSEILAFSYVLEVETDCLMLDRCKFTQDHLMQDFESMIKEMSQFERSEFLQFSLFQGKYFRERIDKHFSQQ